MGCSYQGRHPPSQLAVMVAHTNIAYDNQQWYVDSGANAYIYNFLNIML